MFTFAFSERNFANLFLLKDKQRHTKKKIRVYLSKTQFLSASTKLEVVKGALLQTRAWVDIFVKKGWKQSKEIFDWLKAYFAV